MTVLAAIGIAWSSQASAAHSNFDRMCGQDGDYQIRMDIALPYVKSPISVPKDTVQFALPNGGYVLIFQDVHNPTRLFVAKQGLYIAYYEVASYKVEPGKCRLTTTNISPPEFVKNWNQVIQ